VYVPLSKVKRIHPLAEDVGTVCICVGRSAHNSRGGDKGASMVECA